MSISPLPHRQIRAQYTPSTITVYQAYPPSIATAAVQSQTLNNIPGFKTTRMTWIKPSFLWMGYRSGFATKTNQECVLAIEISREGFEWALQHSVLSHISSMGGDDEKEKAIWKKKLRETPVRIQWDPERDLLFRPLGWRSIQIGLSGEAVEKYITRWIVSIRDVTGVMREAKELVDCGELARAAELVPRENVYEVDEEIRGIIGSS
ncbi:hypothetical protein BDW59DRAFT_178149 [Aspergillus cavernicola]|uniref:DUF4291 domain-containing protein n=1 Tax=Aspergillus cavernicola TaxID=176166 RepID=A0ABR4HE68_9EURO